MHRDRDAFDLGADRLEEDLEARRPDAPGNRAGDVAPNVPFDPVDTAQVDLVDEPGAFAAAGRMQIVREDVGRHNAALTLNRLQHHRTGRFIHTRFECIQIVVWDESKTLQDGVETLADFLLSGGRKGRHGASVKRLFHGDDAIAPGLTLVVEVFPCQLNGRLIGFGATVAEKYSVGKTVFNKPIGQFDLGFGVVKIGYMP